MFALLESSSVAFWSCENLRPVLRSFWKRLHFHGSNLNSKPYVSIDFNSFFGNIKGQNFRATFIKFPPKDFERFRLGCVPKIWWPQENNFLTKTFHKWRPSDTIVFPTLRKRWRTSNNSPIVQKLKRPKWFQWLYFHLCNAKGDNYDLSKKIFRS